MNKIQTIITKISADSQFRTDLLNDPGEALQKAGFKPNPALVTVLEKLVDINKEITDPNKMWSC